MDTIEPSVPTLAGHYALVNGIRMYFEDCGTGPSLLLLHGGGDTSGIWAPHLARLSGHFRVIAPDSRGHGLTENTVHPLSYRLMADDTAALIQEVGLVKPILCGWSDGANIVLEIGMRYPDLAGGLICCGLYTRISDQYCEALRTWGMLAPGVVDYEKLEHDAPEIIEELKRKHSSLYGSEYWKTLNNDLSVLFLTPLGYTLADYAGIRAPTLILSGDRDEFLPAEEHVETYRFIPGAELQIVPSASHSFPVEHAELFVDGILAYYRRHWDKGAEG